MRLAAIRYRRSRVFYASAVLAALPVLGALVFSLVHLIGSGFELAHPLHLSFPALDISTTRKMSEVMDAFAFIFRGGYLYFGVILSAMTFASSVFREELEDQTLHYLYLQPIPRWMIVVGKFAGFVLVAMPCFAVSLISVKLLMLLPFGASGLVRFLEPASLLILLREFVVIGLGLALYSSVLLGISNLIQNPIPGFMLYGWEAVSNLMPQALQEWSLGFYVKALLPPSSRAAQSVFGMVVEPPSVWHAGLVIVLVPAVCVGLTCWAARYRECLYSDG